MASLLWSDAAHGEGTLSKQHDNPASDTIAEHSYRSKIASQSPEQMDQRSLSLTRAASDIRTRLNKRIVQILEDTPKDDRITKCGPAVLAILCQRPAEVRDMAYEEMNSRPFNECPLRWARLYTDATLWIITTLDVGDWLTKAIAELDMALIIAQGFGRQDQIFSLLTWLKSVCTLETETKVAGIVSTSKGVATPLPGVTESLIEHHFKRRKIEKGEDRRTFSGSLRPTAQLRHPVARMDPISLTRFETEMEQRIRPLVFHRAAIHWPATITWSDPRDLLKHTFGGRRLVPVEVGDKYTDDDWSQTIMPFTEFLLDYMLQDPNKPPNQRRMGYLAKHDLFKQIPEFRGEILIPDYCYAKITGPGQPESIDEEDDEEDDVPRDPELNIWFGPAHTISPLHTDSKHNILTQLVGEKYVRLYSPDQTHLVYPNSKVGDVDMSNTSQVDVDFFMAACEGRDLEPLDYQRSFTQAIRDDFNKDFPNFEKAKYQECFLGAGDQLFIPKGWWHYVRSMSPSCSVSFWWE